MEDLWISKMNVKIVFLIPFLLFSTLILVAYGSSEGTLAVGDTAPDFSLTTAENRVVSLNDYSGKPVLMYFHMALG
jgi:cytochrome oxidase Cu insertion factor (SCO1/SenC/PrrC family)